jgi:cysteine desulfurase
MFKGIEGESILLTMDAMLNIQVSAGSACSSRTLEPSYIILAIGLRHEEAHYSMILTAERWSRLEHFQAVVKADGQTV